MKREKTFTGPLPSCHGGGPSWVSEPQSLLLDELSLLEYNQRRRISLAILEIIFNPHGFVKSDIVKKVAKRKG